LHNGSHRPVAARPRRLEYPLPARRHRQGVVRQGSAAVAYAIAAIARVNRDIILLNLTSEQVKSSPRWNPLQPIDADCAGRLHQHHGRPDCPR
jgi:hypothetical protein